jgi:hypothetical protein
MGTLERGDGNPTLETLELIATGLQIPISELVRAAETGRLPDIVFPAAKPSGASRGRLRPNRVAERSDPDRRS